jgi:hypothetical protein
VTASDGIHTAGDDSDAAFAVPNHPPGVRVVEPDADRTVAFGQTVAFVAEASDPDGEVSGESIEWRSSRDGSLGRGPSISVADLSVGGHTITVAVDDGRGGMAGDSVEVQVVGDPDQVPPPPDRLLAGPSLLVFQPASEMTLATLSIANRNMEHEIDWEAEADASWVRLARTRGKTPADVEVRFVGSQLPAGRHTATITVTSDDVAGQTLSIRVDALVAPCFADCDGDLRVTAADVVDGVDVALGFLTFGDCPALDVSPDGRVTVEELVRAVIATRRTPRC